MEQQKTQNYQNNHEEEKKKRKESWRYHIPLTSDHATEL